MKYTKMACDTRLLFPPVGELFENAAGMPGAKGKRPLPLREKHAFMQAESRRTGRYFGWGKGLSFWRKGLKYS